MLKILKYAVVVLAVLIGGVLAYATTKPDTFRVERTASIKAPPEKIFPMINELRANLAWSPFEKDPNIKRRFNEVAAGKGAAYAWEGNSDVGKGNIMIVESTEPSRVAMKLHMISPFESVNDVAFTLKPNGSGTDVTWAMHGPQPYFAKVIATFIDCERMVGSEFEKGLTKLKVLAEKSVASK